MMGKKGKIFAGLIAGAAAIVAVKNKDKIVEKMNRLKEEKEGIFEDEADETAKEHAETVYSDTTGDGKLDTAYVDTTGDGVVDKTVDLNGEALQADTKEIDTTGDGNNDTVALDTTGDGQYDTIMTDTTGDGKLDSAFVDTTGDGVVDTTVDLEKGKS